MGCGVHSVEGDECMNGCIENRRVESPEEWLRIRIPEWKHMKYQQEYWSLEIDERSHFGFWNLGGPLPLTPENALPSTGAVEW